MATTNLARPPLHYGFIILGTMVLSTIAVQGLGRFAITLILPAMKEALKLSYVEQGLLVTALFSGWFVSNFLTGLLMPRLGGRLVMTAGMGLAALCMGGAAVGPTFTLLLVILFLGGLGIGSQAVATLALVAAWFAARRRGSAAGTLTGSTGIGTAFSGALIPWVILTYGESGWRWSWAYLGITMAAFSMLVPLLIRNSPAEKGLAPIGAEVFPTEENEAAQPPSLAKVLRHRLVWYLCLCFFFFGATRTIYTTFFAEYLQSALGLPVTTSGRMWALAGLVSIVGAPLSGWLSDHAGRKTGITLGCLLSASASLLVLIPTTWGGYASAVFFGLSLFGVPAIIGAACGDYVGPELASAAVGMTGASVGLGQLLGPPIAGWAVDVSGSFTMGFLIGAASTLLASASALLLLPSSRRRG